MDEQKTKRVFFDAPPDLHAAIKAAAALAKMSMQEWIAVAARERLERKQADGTA